MNNDIEIGNRLVKLEGDTEPKLRMVYASTLDGVYEYVLVDDK
jgi:hypothetical protein